MAVILLVEDDVVTQVLVKNLLTSEGHTVQIAHNGEDVLETLKSSNNMEIIVTDVMMPGMDGRELIKKINEDKTIQEMPINIMSRIIKSSEVWGLLDSGATYFIPKPVKQDVLRDYISLCIKDCELLRAKKEKA